MQGNIEIISLQNISINIVCVCVQYLVHTPVVRQVEAVLRGGEPLHLQDPSSDGHSGQVDLSTGLLKAHRVIHR